METDPWIGFVIDGRYRVDAVVAEGGFGTVYRGFHVGLGRPVAIKLLRVESQVAAELGPERARLVADLRTEGATLQQLSTQTASVVQALDVGEATSPSGHWAPYLVLEWVDGEQLAKYLERRGPMPIAEIIPLLDGAATALSIAHAGGIAHRDVKPENILVARVGDRTQTKLLDFGVAKVMTNDVLVRARAATKLSFVAFTPGWGAPEQFHPALGHTGTWTDVYSFALVIVALLIGRRPYEGGGVELAVRALDPSERPTPRTLGASVPDAVERVLARAVALHPSERPPRVGELWNELRDALTRGPVVATPVAPGRAAPPPEAPTLTGGGAPAPQAEPPREPRTALSAFAGRAIGGDFRLVRELSRGGMGAVFVADQLSTGKQRAVKLMHPSLVESPRMRERFEQEARVAARIPSEHIVEVIAAGVDDQTGTPWLAMELLEGHTLSAYAAERGPLPMTETVELFGQLCHAVGAAHRAGVVHRDLKPDNIFLATARRAGAVHTVKVLDFGIAKVVAEAHTNATANVGTPLWMAPEQANASAPTGPRADVWSLGLIAFRLVTGVNYWHCANDPNATPLGVMSEILAGPIVSASARARELGAPEPGTAFDAWFARCVDRDPNRRFADADELFGAMRAFLVEPRVGPVVAARSPIASADVAPIAVRPPPGSTRRGAVVVVLALAGVLVAVFAIKHRAGFTAAESTNDTASGRPRTLGSFDVASGDVPGGGTMSGFHVSATHAPKSYLDAVTECFAAGQRLCSELQWATACAAHPPLGNERARTSTWDGGWVTRGGSGCTKRVIEAATTAESFRCCSHSVPIRSLSRERARALEREVLAHERAVNDHDAEALARMFAPGVDAYFTLRATTPAAIERAAAEWFKKWPDQWNLHESCTGEDDNKSALVCRKVAQWDGSVVVADTRYEWRDGKVVLEKDENVARKWAKP